MKVVMKDTSHLSDLELRHLQLREIRAMLRLRPDATHAQVVRCLYDIGKHDNRIDRSAMPERYPQSPPPVPLPSSDGICEITHNGEIALVTFDPDPSKNGFYRRTAKEWVYIGPWTS